MSERYIRLSDSDILHFALCMRSRHTADLSANEAIEHWRSAHGITPTPADGVEEAAVAATKQSAAQFAENLLRLGRGWGDGLRGATAEDHIRGVLHRIYETQRVMLEQIWLSEVDRLLAHDTAPEGE